MKEQQLDLEIKNIRKVKLYGDSHISKSSICYVFVKDDIITICDFTECGIYVASGYIASGVYYTIAPIMQILQNIPDNVPVYAENNTIAWDLKTNNIKTVKDLKEYLNTTKG
jgi:activator of 2-hydroxyglutaryl-CoA dehydratase